MNAYPYLVAKMPHNWAAGGVQFASAITADTRDTLMQRIAEDVALRLFYAALDGNELPTPLPQTEDNRARDEAEAYDPEGPDTELVYLGPARLSAHAAAILRGMQACHVNKAELARRMGVPRSVVSRLTNLLYFKHSAESLRRAAEALDLEIHLTLVPRVECDMSRGDAFEAIPLR